MTREEFATQNLPISYDEYMAHGYQTPLGAPTHDAYGNATNAPGYVAPTTAPPVSQSVTQVANPNGGFTTTNSVNAPNNPLGQVTGGAPNTGAGTVNGLPPEFQALYDQLAQYLQKLQTNGQVINPNVQLDPEHVAQFLAQAQGEIHPYYAGQLKLAQDSLSNTLGYDVSQLNNQEAQAERGYNDNLRTLGESAADQGFAQSGIRKRNESDLAYNTQNTIDQNRSALSYNAGNQARSFAQQYGTEALPGMDINGAPQVTAGQSGFGRSAGSLPLYQLSPEIYQGLTGSQQYQERADVANRQSQLEGAYNTTQGINQARSLNL